MSNLEETEDSVGDFDLDTLIERLKRKPRMAMLKMQDQFTSEIEIQEKQISNLERDVGLLNDMVKSLKSQLESKIPKPLKIDSTNVPKEWEPDRVFNKRWPWIQIDQDTHRVICNRCGKKEHCGGFHVAYSEDFNWFVNTHGACPVTKKQETYIS